MKTINIISILSVFALLFLINLGFMQLSLQSDWKAFVFGLIFAIFGLNILVNYRNFTQYKYETLTVILIYVLVECILAGLYVWAESADANQGRFKQQFASYAGFVYGSYSLVVLSANLPTIHRKLNELHEFQDSIDAIYKQQPAIDMQKLDRNRENYEGLQRLGKNDKEIAEYFNVNPSTLCRDKKKWKI